MLFEIQLGVLASLTDTFTAVGEPGAALLDDLALYRQIEQLAGSANTLPVHDIKFHLSEGRGDLVFDDFDTRTVADHLLPALDSIQPTNIQTDRGIEF